MATAVWSADPNASPTDPKAKAAEAYAKLPLSFIANEGQVDRRVRYYAQGAGFGLYLTQKNAVISLAKGKRGQALHLSFLGANPNARLEARTKLRGKVNYLTGSDHHTGLPTYGRIAYRELWPGIDLVFRGQAGTLTYDLVVKPGADPGDIRLAYTGAESLHLDRSGNLVVDTPLGPLRDSAPKSFQRIGGKRVAVKSSYSLQGGSTYGFELSSYDRSRPLVIDPSLAYSTYLGGSASFEAARGIAVDASGSAYVTGHTQASDFPTTAGAFDTSLGPATYDAFVTKLDPSGSSLVYSTFIGGDHEEVESAITIDASGNAYVTGSTSASDFPTTTAAFDRTFGPDSDAFVAKLDAAGSIAYSTYLGGSNVDGSTGGDVGYDIAIDASGNAYVTGYTRASDFPTTAGAFDTSFAPGYDAFVAKFSFSPPSADLAVTGSDSPDPVSVGGRLTYTISVTNNGPAPATSVTLVDDLPKSVRLRSAGSDRGYCAQRRPRRIECSLADLASGDSAIVTIVVRPTRVGTITNTATVNGDQLDPDLTNNASPQTTSVQR